jgi:hypothetical protein
VIHRDIKPENIMLRGEDSVKVTDFGIARQVGGGTLTMTGAFIGTLAYAAPEQFLGRADHRADIYSLGATLYDMLAGRPPFTGTLEGLLKAIREAPPDLRALAGLPADVTAVIERCLAKDPDLRYQSASLLAAALEDALRGMSTAAATALDAPGTVEEPPVRPGADRVTSGTQATVSTNQTPVSVGIVSGKPLPILGARLSATPYEVILRNHAERQLELRLTAESRDGGYRFAFPSTISVTPGGTATTRLKVSPQARRWRGASQWRSFTVAASGDDGSSPATVDGRYEDKPYGWIPYGMGAAACIIAIAVFLGLLAMAGGGGTDTASAITAEQLASLVLSQADLGPEYAGFQADATKSGTFTNEQAIAASCASEKESDQISRAGRISGYRMTHVVSALGASATPVAIGSETPAPGAPAPSSAEPTPSVFLVSTEVDLFRNQEGAARSLSNVTEEPSRNLQLLGCNDYVIAGETVTFQPSGVGETSIGVEQMAARSGQTAALGAGGAGRSQQPDRRVTVLRFARSNVTGTITIVDAGGVSQQAEVMELAAKLDARISILLGLASASPTASPTPQPTPSATATATPTPAPQTPPPGVGTAATPRPGSGGTTGGGTAGGGASGGGTDVTPGPPQPPPPPPAPVTPGPGASPTPTLRPEVTPPPGTPPPEPFINAGRWDIYYNLVSNPCNYNLANRLDGDLIFQEVQSPFQGPSSEDGRITFGEEVDVFDAQNGTQYIGTFIFDWPFWSFSVPGDPSVDFYFEFGSERTWTYVSRHYLYGNGCELFMEAGTPGPPP